MTDPTECIVYITGKILTARFEYSQTYVCRNQRSRDYIAELVAEIDREIRDRNILSSPDAWQVLDQLHMFLFETSDDDDLYFAELLLLLPYIDINKQYNGRSILYYACNYKNIKLIKTLISYRHDIDVDK